MSRSMPARNASKGFTEEERAAVRARVRELRARPRGEKVDGETEVRKALAAMPPSDRALGEKIHTIVRTTAPGLVPRTWYGMPAYAKDGDVLCWFKCAAKFKTRYATMGFSDVAMLDEGHIWPTEYALTELTAADEARIAQLVKQAVG
jgi:uncharacterized protein YdhG (YjbR/CyaY superfamily)